MMRTVTWIHFVSVSLAYLVLFRGRAFVPRTTNSDWQALALHSIVIVLAVLGVLTGMGLMARKRLEQESILLAITTVAAVLLLLLLPPLIRA